MIDFDKLNKELGFCTHDKEFITYEDGSKPKHHVSELTDKSVTPKINQNLRMNSYARAKMPAKLTDETLHEALEHYMLQCTRSGTVSSTYNEAIIFDLLPELLKRIKSN